MSLSLLTFFNDFILAVMVTSLLCTTTLVPVKATESAIWCLKSIKDSLEDPYHYLDASWNFDNNTEGYICRFTGIDSWHPDENKVLNILLPDMGLKGQFPRGLPNCTSTTGLDLSSNELYGPIPFDISSIIGNLTKLNLSSNNFSGEIPQAIANCLFLDVLELDHNQFVGPILPRIGLMDRLRTLSVANNRLTGEVAPFPNVAFLTAESFANNSGLCGAPLLTPCKQHRRWRFDCSFKVMVWSLLSTTTLLPIKATESDISCLKSFKDSLEDPYDYWHASWDFNNYTEGFICKFTGVDCWHADENKVLNIELPDMGLKGPFPRGLQNCTSMTGLDLSNNDLYGPIPSDISSIIGNITSLNLSSNNFSGEIPQAIENLSFLNVLMLDHNQFVGSIPPRIGLLNRLKIFSVANNRLTGEVPHEFSFSHEFGFSYSADSFANNSGLCGAPLSHCKQHRRWRFDFSFKSGFVIGYVLFFVSVTVASMSYCTPWVQVGSRTKRITIATMAMLILRRRMNKQRQVDHVADSTIMQTSQEESKEISRLEMLAAPLSYHDISDATNSFSENNVIGSGETGMMYKATLPNGFSLAVKRLKESHFHEEQITPELKALGVLRHPNLLPLLGFCVTSVERLMVYKHMPNGNLYDWLHPLPTKDGQPRMLEWPVREKIALGLARGLTWLHQHENFRIIHNNVCSRSILLDQNFEPKLSNFGEAMIINRKDTFEAGATGVDRDFWEMAFVKEDVYCFGVVLLELITGQDPSKMTSSRNHSCGGAPFSSEWMSHLLSSFSSHYEAIDKCLIGQGFDAEILQFLQVATDCVQPNPHQRPTMLQIYEHMKTFVKNRAQKNLVYPIITFEV